MAVIIIFYYYQKISTVVEYNKIFPAIPKIGNIEKPQQVQSLYLNNINFPFLEGGHLYYFDNNGLLIDGNLNQFSQQIGIISTQGFNSKNIINVRWFNNEKLIVYQANPQIQRSDEDIESSPEMNNLIIFNRVNSQSWQLDRGVIDSIWSEDGKNIYYLTKDISNNNLLFEINDNGKNKKQIFNFGKNEIYFLENQNVLYANTLYYLKFENNLNLYSLNLITLKETKIFTNLTDANISPNGRYAYINNLINGTLYSQIFDIVNMRIIHRFKDPILNTKIIWDNTNTTLYYSIGENLKIGDETKNLNREASYVFFKYNIGINKEIQLNNHIPLNPMDPTFLMLSSDNNKLYFLNLPQKTLYYLQL